MKRAVDMTLGIVLLLLALPIMGIVALAIALSSPGPVLFSQLRLGRHGQLFRCYKFRSMKAECVTPVGLVLRRSSLDELPQLWNVVRGNMSLVGPRPYLPREAAPRRMPFPLILSVPPGLTGLWQTRGRKNLSFEERLQYDTEYVQRRSFGLDLALLVATIPSVLRGRGAY